MDIDEPSRTVPESPAPTSASSSAAPPSVALPSSSAPLPSASVPSSSSSPTSATSPSPSVTSPSSSVISSLSRIIPIVCLAITAALWLQVRTDIGALKESQRALATEVAAMRKTPIIDVSGAPALGPADARVTLVEFSDYECPFCIRHFTQTMPQLRANFIDTGKIRYVFRDFPIDELHPAAIHAHKAAHCAAEQGRFWELHTRLFSAPGTHTDAALEARATEAGVTLPAFRACIETDRTVPAIRATASLAAELGATGTPAFFVGLRDPATEQVKVTQFISGAQPYDVFARALDALAEQK